MPAEMVMLVMVSAVFDRMRKNAMLGDSGTVMVFVARFAICPAASAYVPVTAAADCNTTDEVAVGIVMVLESKVTAPFLAKSLPSTAAPVVSVMEVKARMFPLKPEVVPRVAELPTCHTTLAAWAPPLKMTWRPEVVVSVDAIWKMKTALASP